MSINSRVERGAMYVRNTAAQIFCSYEFTRTGAPGVPAFSVGGGHWVVLASVLGAWSRSGLGGGTSFGIRVLGNRSYQNKYYSPATAYLKPLCGTAGL